MNESTITSCEVKPKLSQEETPGQDSSNASSTLLNLPPSILLDQRRRSSCKLSVSPLSVQTRLAASPQRNKEVKQTSETATNSNKPKKKVLNRQQTLQRLPYINVNEIITVDSQQLVETCENGGRKNTGNTRTGNSDKLGHDTIDEESKESGPCDNEQTENESEMSLANVLIEIENLNRKDSVDGNSIRKSEDCVTTKENQEIEENENRIDVKAVEDTNRTESVTENQALDDSTKTAENNNYNYELTRFKVTKSEHEKTNLGRQEECDSASKTTETQLEKYLNIEETSKQIDSTGNNKIDPEKSKDIPGSNDTSNESNACTKTGIGEQTLESEETTNNTGVGTKPNKKDNKSDGQISTAINNNETDNKENETTKTRNSNNTKSATSETLSTKNTSPLNPLNLPDISVSYEQSESQSKDTISEAPKSPLRSDRSPNRSPMRSPKLGDIPTRSVLKNSLYRTDSTDSTKSLEKSPKRSYKVSFSCDVEDNSEQPKSPATKLMHGNSKSLDTESGEQQNTTKKEKKKK
uniref:Uncharacterized protein n=2 Tax=Cacopsylla melanoneura TaxID=428564 RepID=A0A8D8WHD3_9HEMI